MLKALRQSESLFSRYYLNEEFNDVMFNFELLDDIVIGEPFRYNERLITVSVMPISRPRDSASERDR